MSTKIVTAPAKVAKPLVQKGKPVDAAEQAQPVQDDDAKVVGKEARVTEESAKVILAQADDAKEGEEARTETSENALAANFSFAGEMAQAAEASGSLVTEESLVDSMGYAQADDNGGPSGTVLLIGAVALVGLGIAVLADGGDDEDQDLPPLNSAPVFGAAPTVDAIDEDSDGTTFTVTATDADSDPITYSISSATGGTATVTDGGVVTFIPAADFSGDASVTVSASDGTASATQTVTIEVTGINDAPVAADDVVTITGTEDTDITVTPTITDPDGDDLTYTFTDPSHGTVAVADDGTIVYTPDANYFGTDTFELTATDPDGESATQTINIVVEDDMDPNDPTGPANVSIDVGTTSTAVTLDDAADASVNFVDDATVITNVILTGVGEDDTITILGDPADYSYASSGNDLRITFSDGTNFNDIIIQDILPDGAVVYNEATAETAVGFGSEFISFG
ncbi:hypothetical protein B2G71_13120 [Novosphingobium sp. PC22D]|uniref:Ig-like domain-containing protein n=1 Tax=Novosphingobium sp. PC22D TaxID=1962403 RepID=UPI000BF13E8D|nr:Ig-like domain-containing protein [Novosphingobium sp. PC22D]PEQ12081.1 hypothetical protein B2G71_13120 [Novosphingobium sp. PC22D]